MSNLFDPIAQAREAGASAIDEPIINGPFDPPQWHWHIANLDTGESQAPEKRAGRRDAGYFIAPKGARGEESILNEQFVPLHLVNEIRRRVAQWREQGYRGVTPVTLRLLNHWSSGPPDRTQRMFYCQREAVETLIWLHEAHPADRQGLFSEDPDGERVSLERAHEAFRRYCLKMATGTGKTIVMGMIIAWSSLNKAAYPQDTRFSDSVLIVAPGVTVKDRLSVLIPNTPGNYYSHFDLIPKSLQSQFTPKIEIIHRQELAILDDSNKKGVRKLGRESDSAFANRILKRALGSKRRILVLNDEGHHCYRPRLKPTDPDKPTKEEKDENERAAQWITGLEKIHAAREILSCVDMSATPFFIHGSGYPVGKPFPWIVSDFGLVDAIESGLVKIPQIPVDDNHGDAKSPPAYFHLWKWINSKLPNDEKETLKRKAKPEAVVREADGALITMVGNWKREFEEWQKLGSKVPPCLIVVTADTTLSQLIFDRIQGGQDFFVELKNSNRDVTYLYDSKELKNAEEGESAKDAEKRKREIMNSVGKEAQPGEQVRCIVSVAMLTEGWDASNVTQILGLRGFTSSLLCEQVVGRALRRRSYDVDPETGMLTPEYADVYGVPFQVIPVKAKSGKVGPVLPPSTLIQSLQDRAHLAINFPRVEGYVTEISDSLTIDWNSIPGLRIGKSSEPTTVDVKATVGYRIGRPDRGGPGVIERQDRTPFYHSSRVQSGTYAIASSVVSRRLPGGTDADAVKRAWMFPQVLELVRRYVAGYVIFEAAPEEEINLLTWQDRIINIVSDHLVPALADGSAVILPLIERYRGEGSTSDVLFRTTRPCRETLKSHISHVVIDSAAWENSVARTLEESAAVFSYARNDHLDFVIPYTDAYGDSHVHRPDFIVKMQTGLQLALEVKGYERELDEYKVKAGKKWADAVNRYYGEDRWEYVVCRNPDELAAQLESFR